jgi:hypothetical protein
VRQGQQNRRGRGRNNNNRKGGGHHHNPLSRSFESNGPDVKIRGTPAHIAEKYIALARDAQSSGDPVLAENYLQHAEHYSRIIMAYREQLNPQGEGMNGSGQRGPGEGGEEFGDDDGEDAGDDNFPQPHQPPQQAQNFQPQPQRQHDGGQHRNDRNFRRDQGRSRDRYNDRNDRGDRGGDRDRNFDRGGDRQEARRPPQDRPPQDRPPQDRPPQDQQGEGGGDAKRQERFPQQPHEQPEFLRRPVRRARVENGDAKDETQD